MTTDRTRAIDNGPGAINELKPLGPPGRVTRKARAFESEIGRLTRDGYNSEAIRQALESAGVTVSRATVRREMRRHEMASLSSPTTYLEGASVR